MGILINRMPDFAKMNRISNELDKHPEETEKLIKELEENIVTDEEIGEINHSGGSIDYGGRIVTKFKKE